MPLKVIGKTLNDPTVFCNVLCLRLGKYFDAFVRKDFLTNF